MTSFNLLRIGPRRRKNIPLSPPFAVVRPRLCGPHQILPKIGNFTCRILSKLARPPPPFPYFGFLFLLISSFSFRL